jgi:hypothetical protein
MDAQKDIDAVPKHEEQIAKQKSTIAELKLKILTLDRELRENGNQTQTLERENTNLSSQWQLALSEAGGQKSTNKAYQSLDNEFKLITHLLDLDRDVQPAQITQAVAELVSKTTKQQFASDTDLMQKATTAEV